MDKNTTRYNVQLYIYDLSRGMARSLSPIMLGKLSKDEESDTGWPRPQILIIIIIHQDTLMWCLL